jgi:hypothetical protein
MFWVISTALVLQGVIIIVARGPTKSDNTIFYFWESQKKPISFEMSELKCFMFVLQKQFCFGFQRNGSLLCVCSWLQI